MHLPTLKESTQTWLEDRKIKSFYTVNESNNFEEGAKTCLTSAGLGKLAPNMLLMGFKADWGDDLVLAQEYFSVLQAAFDQNFSVGVLRVGTGLDFSDYLGSRRHNSFTSHVCVESGVDNDMLTETVQRTDTSLEERLCLSSKDSSWGGIKPKPQLCDSQQEPLSQDILSAMSLFQVSSPCPVPANNTNMFTGTKAQWQHRCVVAL